MEVQGTGLSAVTDSGGYFEINGVPENAGGYSIKISKPNYLYRVINRAVTGDVQIGAQEQPVDMWAGDMVIGGVQNNVIDISDYMDLGQSFNSELGDEKYVRSRDLNLDGMVNMDYIMIAT